MNATHHKVSLAASVWLELNDAEEIRLCVDLGDGFDIDTYPAPDDYAVPARLVDEWHRLDKLRKGE